MMGVLHPRVPWAVLIFGFFQANCGSQFEAIRFTRSQVRRGYSDCPCSIHDTIWNDLSPKMPKVPGLWCCGCVVQADIATVSSAHAQANRGSDSQVTMKPFS